MANMFRLIGSWFGFGRKSETNGEMPLIDAVAQQMGAGEQQAIDAQPAELPVDATCEQGGSAETIGQQMPAESAQTSPIGDAIDEAISGESGGEVPVLQADQATQETETPEWEPAASEPVELLPLDGPTPWGEPSPTFSATAIDPEAAVAQANSATEPVASPVGTYLSETASEAASPTPEAPVEKSKEEAPAPVEMKPSGRPSITFTQLYELIATEVSKRTDSAVGVYERMLGATREELETTRRNNRIAWSIGGVMTAIAAFGGIWAASEVSATRVEVGALKTQLTVAAKVVTERDELRVEVAKTKEAASQIEVDSLKTRLDEALKVSAERDRLRREIEAVSRVRQEMEAELRMVKTPATQPVSMSKPAGPVTAAKVDKPAMGAERQDVWSVLLNGKE